jgi:transposase
MATMRKQPSKQHTARLRAELIMKVRCGLITARQAAQQLGVSRKTYYKWEQRGLMGLLDGVADQSPGRPPQPSDNHRQALERQLSEAHQDIELLNQKMALKDVLMDLKLQPGCDWTKKK